MGRLFKLQFLGPLALFVATLAAELAAQALAFAPTNEWLWFANLQMFAMFQRSYYLLSDVIDIPGFQLFGLALPILLLGIYGLVAQRRLALAIASNLSFAYATFLLLSWQPAGAPTALASLGSIAMPSGAGLYVLGGILGSSLVSFVLSHLLYLHAARAEAR